MWTSIAVGARGVDADADGRCANNSFTSCERDGVRISTSIDSRSDCAKRGDASSPANRDDRSRIGSACGSAGSPGDTSRRSWSSSGADGCGDWIGCATASHGSIFGSGADTAVALTVTDCSTTGDVRSIRRSGAVAASRVTGNAAGAAVDSACNSWIDVCDCVVWCWSVRGLDTVASPGVCWCGARAVAELGCVTSTTCSCSRPIELAGEASSRRVLPRFGADARRPERCARRRK